MKIFPVVQQPQAAHRRNPAKQQNPPHHENPRDGLRVWGAHATRVLANASSHSRTLPVSFLQVSGDCRELLKRSFRILHDLKLVRCPRSLAPTLVTCLLCRSSHSLDSAAMMSGSDTLEITTK
jgi:hypothetical protein